MTASLRLGRHTLPDGPVVMAIVNRTPDSFFDKGATWAEDAALRRVAEVVSEGAQIVDIGGVKAAPGGDVDAAEEKRRVVDFVAQVREAHPSIVISVDTYRSEVAAAVCEAGADLINDTWGGVDPEMASVAAQYDVGLICAHAGGVEPRTRPYRIRYDDVVRHVIETTTTLAEKALAAGVARESIIVDPAHDFGKNTFHSLEVTRRLGEMTALGWPVLVSVSNKDFVGESLDLPVDQRFNGTLAATAACALAGARIFRAHSVRATQEAADMAWCISGRTAPRKAMRGLA